MLEIEHDGEEDEESGEDLTQQALRARLAWRSAT